MTIPPMPPPQPSEGERPLWRPEPYSEGSRGLGSFGLFVEDEGHLSEEASQDYAALWTWSVEDPERFWGSVWEACRVFGRRADGVSLPGSTVPGRVGFGLDRMAPPDPELGPVWFPDARLNFAWNVLVRGDDEHESIVA